MNTITIPKPACLNRQHEHVNMRTSWINRETWRKSRISRHGLQPVPRKLLVKLSGLQSVETESKAKNRGPKMVSRNCREPTQATGDFMPQIFGLSVRSQRIAGICC
jgi:hypothetical protein